MGEQYPERWTGKGGGSEYSSLRPTNDAAAFAEGNWLAQTCMASSTLGAGVAGSIPPSRPRGVEERQTVSMNMRERIQQVNIASYAAWNGHDPDWVAALFAPDGEIVDVTSGVRTRGRDAIRALAVDRFTGFPDFSLERCALLIDGNNDANRWIMRATHTGAYMGIESTGRSLEVCGATFSEYDDDALVVRVVQFVDVPAILHQLGLD